MTFCSKDYQADMQHGMTWGPTSILSKFFRTFSRYLLGHKTCNSKPPQEYHRRWATVSPLEIRRLQESNGLFTSHHSAFRWLSRHTSDWYLCYHEHKLKSSFIFHWTYCSNTCDSLQESRSFLGRGPTSSVFQLKPRKETLGRQSLQTCHLCPRTWWCFMDLSKKVLTHLSAPQGEPCHPREDGWCFSLQPNDGGKPGGSFARSIRDPQK